MAVAEARDSLRYWYRLRLVRAAHAAGITVIAVPGPSAITAALSIAGIATDRFCFEGFLPAKRSARRERLTGLASETRTIVLYEAVHRIAACVADLCDVFGPERNAFVGRELTKLHEQSVRGTLAALVERPYSKRWLVWPAGRRRLCFGKPG